MRNNYIRGSRVNNYMGEESLKAWVRGVGYYRNSLISIIKTVLCYNSKNNHNLINSLLNCTKNYNKNPSIPTLIKLIITTTTL